MVGVGPTHLAPAKTIKGEMIMSLSKSAAEFKKLSSSFKAIFEFAEEVEKIANLDEEKLKADQATSAANKTYADALLRLQSVQAQAAITENKAQELLDNAQVKADAIINGAKAQSGSMIQDAAAQRAKLEDKIAESNAELASIKDEIKLSKVEYQEIEDRIKEVKKKLSDFVG